MAGLTLNVVVVHLVRVKDLNDEGCYVDRTTITVNDLHNLVTSLFDDLVSMEEKRESVELSVNWILKCYDRYVCPLELWRRLYDP